MPTICGYDMANGNLCRETKLNANGHCKVHAPEYEPQHTPTPWRLTELGRGTELIVDANELATVKFSRLECVTRETARANAAFIVQAVNIHAAMLRRFPGLVNGESDVNGSDLVDFLYQEIAKAEGK